MIDNVKQLLTRFNHQVEFCSNEIIDVLESTIESMNIYRRASGRMYSLERNIRFRNLENEIQFYKELKPSFVSHFFFCQQIIYLEKQLSQMKVDDRLKALKKKRTDLLHFDTNNSEFAVYLKSKKYDDDKFYFNSSVCSRCLYDENLFLEMKNVTEPKFDILTAQYMANQKLDLYLISELKKAEIKMHLLEGKLIKWTGSQAELVELIYSLHSSRVLGDGKEKLTTLVEVLSFIFDFKISNHVKVFEEIRERTNSRTRLLDKLNKNLIHYMNEKEI